MLPLICTALVLHFHDFAQDAVFRQKLKTTIEKSKKSREIMVRKKIGE